MRMSHAEFEKAVADALKSIPGQFQPYLETVVVEIEDRPSPETARSLETPRDELLGCYIGTPLNERSVEDGPRLPDRVVVYQRNLQEMCRTRAELVREIAVTILHEVGHHFGLDEDLLDELGFG